MSFINRRLSIAALIVIGTGIIGTGVFAEKLPKMLRFDKKGAFTIDSCAKFNILHFDSRWYGSSQRSLLPTSEQPVISPGAYHIEGILPVKPAGVSFNLIQNITATKPDMFNYEAELSTKKAIECKFLTLALSLPVKGFDSTIAIDGKTIVLSALFTKKTLFNAAAKKIIVGLPSCKLEISGDFKVFVQGRFPKGDYFAVRISPLNMPAKVKDWKLKLKFKIIALRSKMKPLDLRAVANAGFKDDKPNDGKGGWTDQGAVNDLSQLKPGKLSLAPIEFDVIDPQSNNGRSCLVLSGNQRKFNRKIELKVTQAATPCRYLYLLHASAWPPSENGVIGKITAIFKNGSKREILLRNFQDCADWWNPSNFPNAMLAWSSKNKSAHIGLYVSRFKVGEIPEKITFESGPFNVWMIVGATFSDLLIPPSNKLERTTIITSGPNWLPLEFTGKTVSGSALDFSIYLDAPAGKYGKIIVSPDGHFTFKNAPDKRIRFFGPNLVGSANYLNKEQADDFVRKAVRLGYNTVRFHHFEYGLLKRGASDSLTFDPAALDKLDYLFAELKKHGIYITIDLYASRRLKAGDGIEECDTFKRYEMKALAPISPSALKNWKEFARRLLTHKNPYTGLSMAQDPALCFLNLINENPLVHAWKLCPATIPIYEKKFNEYLKANKIAENTPQRDGHFIHFLNKLQAKCIDEQIRFLKQDIKLQTLISDLNHRSLYSIASLRDKLDLVDNHQYWDHPRFAGKRWSYPFLFTAMSSISQDAANPRKMMPTRIFGKPFTVTEFNFCNPNPYRMECAALVGGYAALQGWDALYRFAWSHNRTAMYKLGAPNHFDLVNNPQALLAERIIYMLFMRGDVKPAKPAYAFTFSPEQVLNLKGFSSSSGRYPVEFTKLGLYARIGSLSKSKSFPGVMKLNVLSNWMTKLPSPAQNALAQLQKSGIITSATGQITLNNKKPFVKVCTPKSEVISFKGKGNCRVMSLRNANHFQTMALMSLDDKDLQDSQSILLIHMPNVAASGQKITTGNRLKLKTWGKLPILLEKTKVDVELSLPAPMTVKMLKLDGSFNGVVQSKYENGSLFFTANTAAKKGGVMIYLLTRQ